MKDDLASLGDMHTNKDSHLSIPISAGQEVHLRTADVAYDCKPGEGYTYCVPMVCTSGDDETVRFKQIDKPYILKGNKFENKPFKKYT